MTDHAERPAEIEIQTDEAPTVRIRSFISSTDTDVLTTTGSNAEVMLFREWERIRGGHDHDWVKPLGTLLPIFLALLTTNFVRKFSVSGETWRAVFIIAAIVSAGWLVRELIRRKRRQPALTPRQVVDLLKIPPQATPSTSALAAARSDGVESPTGPQAHGAGSPEKVPVSAPQPGVARNHVSPSPQPGSHSELDSRLLRTLATDQDRERGSKTPIMPFGADSGGPALKVSSGGRVRHPNFGLGTVLDIRTGPTYTVVEVKFDDPDVGAKKLRADLAPLRSVDEE